MTFAQPFFLEGKIAEVLSGFDDNTFDACLCDPPYLLEFMGKEFDRQHKGMVGENDGQRMYAWHLEWAREVYRVLKPGAFLMAFGGTRTVHRLTCALEDVGFEIRDTIEWMYGSGFPKSLDISKAIDKANGDERKVIGHTNRCVGPSQKQGFNSSTTFRESLDNPGNLLTAPGSEESAIWTRYGTALKPAHEPVILAMKPTAGTFVQNALVHGVAGLNVDGGRIPTTDTWCASDRDSGPSVALSGGADGSLNNQRSGSHAAGRWPANLILSHHPSCQETGTVRVRGSRIDKPSPASETRKSGYCGKLGGDRGPRGIGDEDGMETVPTYDCHPLCPVRMLDEQVGPLKSGRLSPGHKRGQGRFAKDKGYVGGGVVGKEYGGDSGGPSRFFYTAKVSTRERNLGGTSCNHPTLKPLSLCRYLATLLLPPPRPDSPRCILIPFSGAGSEAIGASLAGWDEITGIEMSPEYIEQAWARSSAALQD